MARMKTKTIGLTLALCFLATAACFAADPQMGTWKLNEAKSKLSAGATKNNTVIYEAAGDNIKVTVDGVDAEGKPALGDVARHAPATSVHRPWGEVGVQEVVDTALAWSVGHVLGDAGVRRRLATELGAAGAPPFDPQRVAKLEYLDAVCRETLRLTPIIPLGGRRLTRSRSGRYSRSTFTHTKASLSSRAVPGSSKDSCSMTWHQWQAA